MTNKKMGGHGRGQHGAKGAGREVPGSRLDEFDIADEMKGDNALQANDQRSAHSERQAQAGASGETDALMESFRKTDKRRRAAVGRARAPEERRDS